MFNAFFEFEFAYYLTTQILLISILIQSFELLNTQASWNDFGVWSYRTLRPELLQTFPKAIRLFDTFLSEAGFRWLLTTRGIICTLILLKVTPLHSSYLILFLVFQILINIRFRGVYNGGSDMMTLIVLIGAITHQTAGLLFIAVYAVCSYFLAGVCKIKQRDWRTGFAISHFLKTSIYPMTIRHSLWIEKHASWVFFLMAWATLIFECLFPLSLLDPNLCAIFIGIAFVFHCANASLFGLNRFLWAWMATWPSLLFCCKFLNSAY